MAGGQGGGTPGNPTRAAGLPSNPQEYIFEKFDGLNTKPLRPAIEDGEMSVCDGFIPLGPSNLRTLYGIGDIPYSTTGGLLIIWHQGCNLGDTPGVAFLLTDGSIHFLNQNTNAVSQVMPAGTIQNPSTILGFRQWATPVPMLIFAKDQTNGYWLWDGTNLYAAGTVSPEVDITNSGLDYTFPPTVSFQTTGSGTGATWLATLENGSVSQITVVNPGTGFAATDLINLYITGGGSDDSAVASANLSGPAVGGVSEVVITQGGNSYTGNASMFAAGGGGSGASFALSIVNGVIESAAVINPGTGYVFAPTPGVFDPPNHVLGLTGGTGFQGEIVIAFGQVLSLNVLSPGSGYVTPPIVKIIGDGTGAQAVAQISNGQVTGFVMQNYGSGYTYALVQLSGGNNAANATTEIMPFGISGTSIEVYNNQVFVSNGSATAEFPPKNRVIGSQPGSDSGFDPTQGAIAFQSNNAQLRVGYHSLIQTNGFLYLIGDSAVDQISGVQTTASGTTSTTTFNVINVDPQIGTPWPSSVQLLNRDIVFANTLGVFVSYGGAVTKISDALDGFYSQGPIYGNTANFSSAVAQIFGRYVYMLLLPVFYQGTGVTLNTLLMWDGKRWWTSRQDAALTYISTQEINSLMTAWGTDGTSLFPLFAKPSIGFTKTAQSKLWAMPGYDSTKLAMHLLGIINFYIEDEPVNVSIDSEVGQNSAAAGTISPGFQWTNNTGGTFSWTNGASPFVWSASGLVVFGPQPVGGYVGRLSGMTVTTNSSDLALLSLKLIDQITSLTP